MVDITIIGAGVMGAAAAYFLSKYQCNVVVLEKENDVAEATSLANSGIIHSGHDPKPNTDKARFNVLGNRMYPELCKHLHVLFRQTGAFVVAVNEEEREILQNLKKQAEERGIPCEEMDGDRARQIEPNLSETIIAAISLPTTGIVDPWEITLGMMEEAVLNGCDLRLNHKVVGIKKREVGGYQIEVEDLAGQKSYILESKYIVNCAGVYADKIYAMLEEKIDYTITPRRGQYFVLDNTIAPIVSRPIYPVPSALGKGILAIPTIHGNVLLGPDSEFIEDKEGINVETERLDVVRKGLAKTMRNIPFDKAIRSFAGLRATGSTGDFVIREEENHAGFIQAACLESPGLTAAPAIGKYVAEELIGAKENYPQKTDYQNRRPPIRLEGQTLAEKNEWVKKDSRFAEMICRCESISEAEILDSIHRPVGATTIKGVKKRTRPGAGRCQGGFCEPRVVEILARELGISPLDVRYDSINSAIFVSESKQGGSHE